MLDGNLGRAVIKISVVAVRGFFTHKKRWRRRSTRENSIRISSRWLKKGRFLAHRSLARSKDETEIRAGEGIGRKSRNHRATRRHFSAEDKIRFVLEGLRGKECIVELMAADRWRRPPRRRVPARSGFICPLSIRTW